MKQKNFAILLKSDSLGIATLDPLIKSQMGDVSNNAVFISTFEFKYLLVTTVLRHLYMFPIRFIDYLGQSTRNDNSINQIQAA